jgi:acetyl-CoA acyltransferase 1
VGAGHSIDMLVHELHSLPPLNANYCFATRHNQVSDGAAAVLMARRSTARRLGLPILAILKSSAVAGVPPAIMGIGPAVAIPKALEKAGLTMGDIDIFEINEVLTDACIHQPRS